MIVSFRVCLCCKCRLNTISANVFVCFTKCLVGNKDQWLLYCYLHSVLRTNENNVMDKYATMPSSLSKIPKRNKVWMHWVVAVFGWTSLNCIHFNMFFVFFFWVKGMQSKSYSPFLNELKMCIFPQHSIQNHARSLKSLMHRKDWAVDWLLFSVFTFLVWVLWHQLNFLTSTKTSISHSLISSPLLPPLSFHMEVEMNLN